MLNEMNIYVDIQFADVNSQTLLPQDNLIMKALTCGQPDRAERDEGRCGNFTGSAESSFEFRNGECDGSRASPFIGTLSAIG